MANYNNRNSRNNNGNSRGNSSQKKKRSGATHTTYYPKTGPNAGVKQYFTRGWKSTKAGLVIVKCVTTGKSKLNEQSGWMGSVACEVTNQASGSKNFYWGTMEAKTGKVVVDSLSWVVNPRAKNGGYCGTYVNSGN